MKENFAEKTEVTNSFLVRKGYIKAYKREKSIYQFVLSKFS